MIKNPKRLEHVLLAYMGRKVSVEIIPQMSGDWAVFVDVPTADSEKQMSFIEPVLEDALEKALDEIDRRRVAREVLD